MSNNQDPPTEIETNPAKTQGIVEDSSLEKTQVFADEIASGSGSAGSQRAPSSGSSSASNLAQGGSKGNEKTVGGYRLVKKLGEGGMGRVFQAVDDSGRMVAIKLLSPELSRSAEALDRFRQEGVIASAISHPHCVFVHRADEDAGTPYIAMELMTGQTLKDLVVTQGPLPVAQAMPLIMQCIDGLIEAHSQGMIHRDVKPANCYLDDQGNVKIGDFGLARSLISDSELTQTGAFLGTPLYSSPEQILGETVDEQSDIYSLAATIYYLLAGKAPFESPNAPQVIAKIVSADPPSFSEAGVTVPKKMEQVVLKGLSRDRTKRFANFQEFRDALVEANMQRERIASIPRRSLAFVIDTMVISMAVLVGVVASFAIPSGTFDFKYFVSLFGFVWQAIYLFGSEYAFGTTIGKRMLNLRVIDPELGVRPKFFSCLVRTTIFILAYNFIEIISTSVLSARGQGPIEAPLLYSLFSWIGSLVGWAIMLSVWWKTGKKKLFHEWVSKTETWVSTLKSVTNTVVLAEPAWQLPVVSVPDELSIPTQLGRFAVRGQIKTIGDSIWLDGHDSTIDRSVWIQWCASTTPPPSESREKCVRRTRMRFLESGLHGDCRWDAYVAPEGVPIGCWFDRSRPMPWPVSRQVLIEAMDELTASSGEDQGESWPIERWWLTASCKLTLAEAEVETGTHRELSAKQESSTLASLVSLALPDRGVTGSAKLAGAQHRIKYTATMIPPWSATLLLRKIKSASTISLAEIRSELDRISHRPQVVTVTMRGLHAAIVSLMMVIPWLIVVVFLAVPAVMSVVDERRDAQRFTTLAAILRDPSQHADFVEQIDAPKRAEYLDPDKIAQIEKTAEQKYEHFLKVYEDLGYFERMIIDQQDQIRGRPPSVSKPKADFSKVESRRKSQEKESAESSDSSPQPKIQTEFGPNIKILEVAEKMPFLIDRFEKEIQSQSSPTSKPWFSKKFAYTSLTIFVAPLVVLLVWGTLWRGGVSHLVCSLTIVRRDGRRAAYWQCAIRSLLFWLPPFLLFGLIVLLDARGTEWLWLTHQLRRCFVILPIIYLAIAVRWPNRGPHDVIAGTYIVPR